MAGNGSQPRAPVDTALMENGESQADAPFISDAPLKATLRRVGSSIPEDKTQELARAYHTVTAIGQTAYIFGGTGRDGYLCSTDVHALTLPGPAGQERYACFPAFPLKDAAGGAYAPSPRARHAACSYKDQLIIHGGCTEQGDFVDDGVIFWVWDPQHVKWTKITPNYQLYTTFAPRSDHHIFADGRQNILVLHGGRTTDDPAADASLETWLYDFPTSTWTKLPPSPAPAARAAYAQETLYTVSSESDLSGSVHYLKLQHSDEERAQPNALVWQTVAFPSNPLARGPLPRPQGVLAPLKTGYLVYLLGKKSGEGLTPGTEADGLESSPEIWSLRLPAEHHSLVASVIDKYRQALLQRSLRDFTWSEVPVELPSHAELGGEPHPGFREFAGAASCLGGEGVLIWGGISPKGFPESDGWVLEVSEVVHR
ncbi:hypothetical protein GQ53DRAFT_104315 [Thozetella sp. PMI_491]|nr:hypothetical protein GQ53DRAFT_104315 [Thozetella sp. PMI_491]